MDVEKLKKLNDLVSLYSQRKNIIVLNPGEKGEHSEDLGKDIIYDKVEWKMPEELSSYVSKLSKDNKLSNENKILLIFEKVCKDYIYDDNLISYIKNIDDDTFSLPDWYGRDTDNKWEKNRKGHNRRVCYELSRYIAKALTELLENNQDFNICIHWNKDLAHYFVGVTCNEYSITIDPDDFFNIKDLTRLKVGLTAQGIKILEDKENKFENTLNIFNKGRSKYAIEKIGDEINNDNTIFHSSTKNKTSDTIGENEDIIFFKKAVEVLSKKYDMDSQGIYEYMKEIIDIRLGSKEREKVWKKIEGNTKESTRYIRCLVLKVDNQKFLIDVDKKILRPFNEEELKIERASFIPYNELSRGEFDYYDGT